MSTPHVQNFYLPDNLPHFTLLKECIRNVDNRDYQVAINASTRIIDNLFDSIMAALDIRAYAFGMNSQVDQGLEDAQQMINCAPFNILGYLRAGFLYSLKSQYKLALKMFKQGVTIVSKENFLWSTLLEHYHKAQEKLDLRIDFIQELPYDIMCLVTNKLPFDTMLEALNVSQAWREIIATCAKPWRNILLSSSNQYQLEATRNALPYINQHIQRLEVRQLMVQQSCEKLFMDMKTGSYCMLTSIKFLYCQLPDHDQCMEALQKVSTTLEELYFDSNDSTRVVIPLGTLLSTCTNIKRLYCQQPTFSLSPQVQEELGIFPATPVYSLIDMTLHFRNINNAILQQILRLCPNLLRLEISKCDTEVAGVIRQSCRNLYSLGINTHADTLDQEKLIKASTTTNIGIRHLYMSLFTEGGEPTQMLSDHASTIETLRLCYRDLGEQSIRLIPRPPNNFIFIQLTNLSLVYSSQIFNSLAVSVLSLCPVLEKLVLGFQELIDLDMTRSIAQLEKLNELEFECVEFQVTAISQVQEGREMMDGLSTMMQTFATRARNGGTSLEKLEFNECYGQFDRVFLESLAGIPTLHTLHLEELEMDQSDFENFAKALASINNRNDIVNSSRFSTTTTTTTTIPQTSILNSMTLRGLDCVSDESLYYISNIQSLRKLKLSRLANVTPLGLQHIMYNKNLSLNINL